MARGPIPIRLPQVAGEAEIARHSLDRSVADQLRGMIVRAEMAPGAKLNLPDLANDFGVSTTPLREALKILVEEGLVEWPPGRGPRVAPIRPDETLALFDVIASLEALAAERAAARRTAAEMAELESMHRQMRGCFVRGERNPYFTLNSQIHEVLLNLAGNDVLRNTHMRLQGRATRGRYIAIVDDARWRQAMQEHEDLMDALRASAPDQAHEVWRRHLINTGIAVRNAQFAATRK